MNNKENDQYYTTSLRFFAIHDRITHWSDTRKLSKSTWLLSFTAATH